MSLKPRATPVRESNVVVLKPYLVQAWNPRSATWVIDKGFETLEEATAACVTLHEVWQRKCRVIDQEERMFLALPVRVNPRNRRTKVNTQ